MLSIHAISRALLFVEAVILMLPSFGGLWIVIGGLYECVRSTGELSLLDCAAFVMLLAGLCSFWRILLWVAADERNRKQSLHRLWWLIASVVACLILLVWINATTVTFGLVWFVFGILYLPTYCHLLFEAKRLNGITGSINRSQKTEIKSTCGVIE